MSRLDKAIADNLDQIVTIRHDLHAHPELGYAEKRTSSVVVSELDKAKIQHAPGLAGGTGVLAYLPATTVSPETAATIALRADMDALPIKENTGKPYSSQNPGVMHACGHDGHTSILIGAAKVLAEAERPNNILLLFQPAEEGGAGGKRMCEDGALDGKVLGRPVDRIFGLHGSPLIHVGQIATRKGAMLASADGFEIRVKGKGGHAAMPHFGIDPIVAASHIVVTLQTIASRNISPLDSIVVTIGQVQAGSASNIIPDEALIVGTLRTLNMTTRELGQRRIREIAASVAEALGAETSISWLYGYPVTWNDPVATAEFREAVGPAFGDLLVAEDVEPVMGAEDFSFYAEKVPACFYWLGLLPTGEQRYPNLHAAEFDFNDDAIPFGVRAMCSLALSEYKGLEAGRRELAARV